MNFKIRNAILCTENTLIVLTRCATSVVRAAENDIFSQRHSFRRVELFMQHPRPSQLRQLHTLTETHDTGTTRASASKHTAATSTTATTATGISNTSGRLLLISAVVVNPAARATATATTERDYRRISSHVTTTATAASVQLSTGFSEFTGSKALPRTAGIPVISAPFTVSAVISASAAVTVRSSSATATTSARSARVCFAYRAAACYSKRPKSRTSTSGRAFIGSVINSTRANSYSIVCVCIDAKFSNSSCVTAATAAISVNIIVAEGGASAAATNHKQVDDFRLKEHNRPARQQFHNTVFSHHVVPCVGKFHLRLTTDTNRGTTYTCHINLRSRPPKRRPCLFFV